MTEDARTARLLDWVQEHVRPGKRFTDERVIVFTEYRATQRYLQERLRRAGSPATASSCSTARPTTTSASGSRAQWQEPPGDYPVRILLATDAASEGISLQSHCHLLAHAEIPWNPNRLEQRNGRVDRHGQPRRRGARPPLRQRRLGERATAAARWRATSTSSRAWCSKVEQIREDLGSAGPVIADQVEEAMLGRRRDARRDAASATTARSRVAAGAGAAHARAARRACATSSTRAARRCT